MWTRYKVGEFLSNLSFAVLLITSAVGIICSSQIHDTPALRIAVSAGCLITCVSIVVGEILKATDKSHHEQESDDRCDKCPYRAQFSNLLAQLPMCETCSNLIEDPSYLMFGQMNPGTEIPKICKITKGGRFRFSRCNCPQHFKPIQEVTEDEKDTN